MAESHVVSALKAKRAELAGRIEHCQEELRGLVIDLDNVDHVLRLFAPDIDLVEIRPKPLPPRAHAFKGEMTRILLEALREAPDGLDSRELARRVMAGRGINPHDARLARTIVKRVGAALRHHKMCGLLTSEQGQGGLLVWRVSESV